MKCELLAEQNLALMLDFIDDERTKYDEAMLKAFLNEKNAYGYIASDNGKAVGFAYGYVLNRPDGQKVYYLHAIDVMEGWQNQGYGRAAGNGMPMIAHSVLEELVIYLCNEEALGYIEVTEADDSFEGEEDYKNRDWEFDLFDDMDIVTCLYSDMYLDEGNIYHFAHWNRKQFYMDDKS